MYGSLAFAERNPDRLRKTVAALCLDTPAPDFNAISSTVKIHMNPDVCPTYTDALYPELFRRYYSSIRSNKLVLLAPFEGGTDTYFAESILGVPTTFVYMENGTGLHHNSRDTIEKVDSRSLRDLCMFTALALYYTAGAGYEDVSLIAPLTFDRGTGVIQGKAREMRNRLAEAKTGEELGGLLVNGDRVIQYYTGIQTRALRSILRIVPKEQRTAAERDISLYIRQTEELGKLLAGQFAAAVREKASASSVRLAKPAQKDSPWDAEAATLYPRATKIGPLTLEGIPPEEWRNLTGSPKWWSPRNWAGASYWWCDGSRNLNEIKEAVEMEAGAGTTFDFIAYYRFLEKHGLVEFVKTGGK
jgi:hypothetical protein